MDSLTDWFRDFLNNKIETKDEDEDENDMEDEEDQIEGPFLDPEWYTRDRNVKKYIPKLSSIALGAVVKIVNVTATSQPGKNLSY